MKNCYNTGTVNGNKNTGGVVGRQHASCTNCYYLEKTAETGTGTGGDSGTAEKTAAEFRFLASVLGEDWADSVAGRPVLLSDPETDIVGADNPYEIFDVDTMKAFREHIKSDPGHGKDEFFKLTKNIDLNDDPWTPIGDNDNPFQGTFDGNNKTISGLKISGEVDNKGDYGLFGYIENGIVKKLSVSGTITRNGSRDYYVGGIAGRVVTGEISDCYFSGNVTNLSSASDSEAGGIVGNNGTGTVVRCTHTGDVKGNVTGGIAGSNGINSIVEDCYHSGSVEGKTYAGGIVGNNYHSLISKCSNVGDVTGADDAPTGGIVGRMDSAGTVTNCYNTGVVVNEGTGSTGGIAGSMHYGSSVTNCYNTGKVIGSATGGIAGKVETHTIYQSIITNCYYLDSTATVGFSQGESSSASPIPKTAEQFASGEVAYLLQNGQDVPATQVWGQTVGRGTPELTGSPEKKVYQITGKVDEQESVVWYSNGKVILPAAKPSKEGYTFAGWSQAENGSVDFTAGLTVSEDTTVYAVFTENHRQEEGTDTPSDNESGDPPKPSESYNEPGGTPKTGDESHPALWFSLMILSLIAIAVIIQPPIIERKKPISINGRHIRK